MVRWSWCNAGCGIVRRLCSGFDLEYRTYHAWLIMPDVPDELFLPVALRARDRRNIGHACGLASHDL